VLVAPGTYGSPSSGIDPHGVNIAIISEQGPGQTTVDATGSNRAFYYHSLENSSSRLEGFRIHGASGERLRCEWASPTIVNCWFTGVANGVWGEYSSPTITGSVFRRYSSGRSIRLFNTDIPDPLISNCAFYGDLGEPDDDVVMYFEDCYPVVERSAIAFSNGRVLECAGAAVVEVTHCVIFAHAGGDSLCGDYHDNLFVDPLWCNLLNMDFEVCENSPCLPDNNPWGVHVGPYGQGCGDCTTPVEHGSWGTIKAMFR
jgi:hypothetical protein